MFSRVRALLRGRRWQLHMKVIRSSAPRQQPPCLAWPSNASRAQSAPKGGVRSAPGEAPRLIA
eukprot:200928-Alexandrium_andersonii.AAC.1